MTAPFRIERPERGVRTTPDESLREYLERLLKMIPGEVVGLYMIGSGFIPEGQDVGIAVWAAICLVAVVVVRIYGTRDPANDKPSQPVPVAISCVAFVIWVYWLGGPFEGLGVHVPWIGSLAVLVWSFIIPIIYRGPRVY